MWILITQRPVKFYRRLSQLVICGCLSVKYLDQYVLEVSVNEWNIGREGNWKEEDICQFSWPDYSHNPSFPWLSPAQFSTPPLSLTQRFLENTRNFLYSWRTGRISVEAANQEYLDHMLAQSTQSCFTRFGPLTANPELSGHSSVLGNLFKLRFHQKATHCLIC